MMKLWIKLAVMIAVLALLSLGSWLGICYLLSFLGAHKMFFLPLAFVIAFVIGHFGMKFIAPRILRI